ncbi:MAG: DUF3883 domain-containing protein [Thermomicrobiales bacterium]
MPDGDESRTRLETEELVIGYAMSRLDEEYLRARQYTTWQQAYKEAATALSRLPTSFKNLRDEFDPVHPNKRVGWHRNNPQPLRPNRQRVLDELQDVSDDALLELVARILRREEDAIAEAIDSLGVVTKVAYNVAERLLTGRRAEEFFLAHSARLVGIETSHILDYRQAARGFDFGILDKPEYAIEVKGIKQKRGDIQFTDREWTEARYRGENYLLAIVGNLVAEPVARIIPNPYTALFATCSYRTSIAAVWRSTVSVIETA